MRGMFCCFDFRQRALILSHVFVIPQNRLRHARSQQAGAPPAPGPASAASSPSQPPAPPAAPAAGASSGAAPASSSAPEPDLGPMLADDKFHRALFAVCAELVAASNSTAGHKFPESVLHCGLRPLDVCAVMEAVVRADSALPRELKRHLNSCHEQARVI